jgi:hypothetical protein
MNKLTQWPTCINDEGWLNKQRLWCRWNVVLLPQHNLHFIYSILTLQIYAIVHSFNNNRMNRDLQWLMEIKTEYMYYYFFLPCGEKKQIKYVDGCSPRSTPTHLPTHKHPPSPTYTHTKHKQIIVSNSNQHILMLNVSEASITNRINHAITTCKCSHITTTVMLIA